MWVLILVLLLIILSLLAYLDTRKPKNFPPGPAWFPVIGCAWQIQRLLREMGTMTEATEKLAQTYGPLIGVRIGRERAVIVYGGKAIEEMFLRDELNARPTDILTKCRTEGERKGIIFTDSEFFNEQKKFVLRGLGDSGFRKDTITNTLEKEVSVLIERIKLKIHDCSVLQMERLFFESSLSTIWSFATGDKCPFDDRDLSELCGIMQHYFGVATLIGTKFSNFPMLVKLCPEYCGYNEYVNANRRIIEFATKKLDVLKRFRDTGENRTLIDRYLDMLDSPEKKESFSEYQLKAICMDFLIAGFETTSHTLGFAFLYLVLQPDIQMKAQEEIDRVVGRGRLPTLEDQPMLPYIQSIVLESLRMFVGRGFLVPRRALYDTTFNGHFIPKDTILLTNPRGMFMNPDEGWKNPSDFNPERFMEDGSLKVPASYAPFCLGKRRCVGEKIARPNLFLTLARLLHTFNFNAIPGEPPQIGLIEGLTPAPHPFKAYVTLR